VKLFSYFTSVPIKKPFDVVSDKLCSLLQAFGLLIVSRNLAPNVAMMAIFF